MASQKKKRRKKNECPLTVGMPDAEDLAADVAAHGPKASLSGATPLTALEVFRRAKKR